MNRSSNSRLPVNYSIKNIIASILQDNAKARSFSDAKKHRRHRNCLGQLAATTELRSLLSITHIKNYPLEGAHNFARIGVLPPELVIVDQRIKDLCMLPYWTIYKDKKGAAYKRFGKCPGYGLLPGCPPKSADIAAVQAMLDQADLFIVLQSRLLSDRWKTRWKFTVLHRLAAEITKLLGPASITGIYGSGPCNACAKQPCLYGSPCGSPKLKTTSLESMGICVDRLCSDLALLTGNQAWRLKWLKHFGLPRQTPKTWKYVQALSVRLP